MSLQWDDDAALAIFSLYSIQQRLLKDVESEEYSVRIESAEYQLSGGLDEVK